MLHPAASRHPKATHQWLLMGVQACRLPALKPLKRLKGLKRLKTLKMLKTLNGCPSLPFASPETSHEMPSLKHSLSVVFLHGFPRHYSHIRIEAYLSRVACHANARLST